ncbi:MAG: sugar phosphate isomerase/epimerase family protein [Vicinamibacteria bacterium]
MNRRHFVQTSVLGLGAAMTLRRVGAADLPDVHFPTEPRARLAVASYPFRQFVDPKKGTLPLLDFPRMVADRYGVPGIEPLSRHFPGTDAAYLGKLRAVLGKLDMHVVDIPVEVHGSFYDPDPARRAVAVSGAKHWVDVAEALASPSIRTHIEGRKGTKPDASLAAQSLGTVADYGAAKGVVIHLENDDPETEEAFFIVDVITRAAHPWLRGLPDFCNSMLLGKGEDYNYKAMAAMFEHAYGISHVKDSEVDGKKIFRVDVARTFAIAKAAGYRGYFSMEWEGATEPYAGTQSLIDASLKALA